MGTTETLASRVGWWMFECWADRLHNMAFIEDQCNFERVEFDDWKLTYVRRA